jgi:putative ABC transport system permease protein
MQALLSDIRLGIRLLVKHPLHSLIIVVTLSLGIGLTTTVFSLVNGVLFKGLPFPDSRRILAVERTRAGDNQREAPTTHDIVDWREQQTVFEGIGAFGMQTVNLSGLEGSPERYSGGFVTADMFDILRARALLGRTFEPGEDQPGAEPVIILSYDVWQTRFGGSADVLGRTVTANGLPHTVIGVMPEGFLFPDQERLWLPVTLDPAAVPRGGEGPRYMAIARLRPGVTLEQARNQMTAIAARLAQAYPEANEGVGVAIKPFASRYVVEDFGPMLLTMLGAVLGVLLIACANVANLLLARATLRTREISVRTALGATRGRVVRQLLTEVLVLASVGGAAGIFLGLKGVQWFNRLAEISPPPFWITFSPDHRVLLFAVAMTVLAALLAGVLPALRASRVSVSETLKDESRGSSSLRSGHFTDVLVTTEIAVSCCLLVVAGLMIKSAIRLNTLDVPFATQNILTARVTLPEFQYPDTASRVAFYERLLPEVRAMPGVLEAALSDGLPARGNGTRVFEVDGQEYATDDDYPIAREGIVTPGYFATFQVGELDGRLFDETDRRGSLPVTVVNESFVRTFFPDGSALGRRIRMGRRDSTASWLTVVGVVPDMKMEGIGNVTVSPAGFYIPFLQSGMGRAVNVALRTAGEPSALAPPLRRLVESIDRDLPIYNVAPMTRVIEEETWLYRIFGPLFMVFGFLALFLAAIGLYGVMSFAVSRRTREMGIRMALGAQASSLVGLVMRKGTIQLAVGLCIGVAVAVVAANPLQWILYDVSARDPWVFLVVLSTLAAVGLLASYLPARRATKVDPVVTLTAE